MLDANHISRAVNYWQDLQGHVSLDLSTVPALRPWQMFEIEFFGGAIMLIIAFVGMSLLAYELSLAARKPKHKTIPQGCDEGFLHPEQRQWYTVKSHRNGR